MYFYPGQAGKTVLIRLLDGVDPQLVDEIQSAVKGADGVEQIAEVRARWSGHQLLAEVNLAVQADLSVAEGHDIAESARRAILRQAPAAVECGHPRRSPERLGRALSALSLIG